ncbi:MAG: carbohydrate-binding domain-containing protein [Anaerolineales bacterium]|nr:carbohydrate-binding domain-containing protein [Anaerolineales bacterium]
MKKIISLIFLATLIFSLATCSGGGVESAAILAGAQSASAPAKETGASAAAQQTTPVAPSAPAAPAVESDGPAADPGASDPAVTYITLEGDSIALQGSGATVTGSIVAINSAGTYNLSGVLNDGQVRVHTQDEGAVTLILDGVDITCSSSAPLYISDADKAVITLADGTENFITDGAAYFYENAESDEPNAAIFSNDDLTINGNGSLTVQANYKNGIASKDDLKITGGDIRVNAVNDGIRGRDSIAVKDGAITVEASGDGLQSNNDEDAEKGYVSIEGGVFNITAGMDGIQAETALLVSGGEIDIQSGGGSANSSSAENWGNWGMGNNAADDSSSESAKGLKAGVDLAVTGGAIQIDSSDDSIHSNGSLTISGGEILLASGDDGVHSDSTLEINGGTLDITRSYEGIESAAITINGGDIRVVSNDDGVNTAGGVDGSAVNGRPGQNPFAESGNYDLSINGGRLVIDAEGDGLDVNGTITMSEGVVIVNGPTNNGNGALDYLGAFNISGGLLVAAGSSGMAQAPSATSSQYSVMHNFQSPQAAGTLVHIESQDGEEILTFAPAKEYQSIVLSSPELENGSTYVIYSGGSSSGAVVDGLYIGGNYTPGAQATSLTITSMVTGAGSFGGGFPGGPGGGAPPGAPGGNPRPPGP